MAIPEDELVEELRGMNPWWYGNMLPDELSQFRRTAWQEVREWITDPPFNMAVLILGPRRVGKSTLMQQQIGQLLKDGVNPKKILYADFEEPILKLAGFRRVIKAWKEICSPAEGKEYLFLDEMQLVDDWGSKIKRQVDSQPNRQIVFSGSAIPLDFTDKQSGVGRWHEVPVGAMSFYEFLRFRKVVPIIPPIDTLEHLFSYNSSHFMELKSAAGAYKDLFLEYLTHGGFPELAAMRDLLTVRRFVRDEVIKRTLTREITDEYSENSYYKLHALFRYFCKNNGGILNQRKLGDLYDLTPVQTKMHLDALLSSQHIDRLAGSIQGKGMFNARNKIYVSDHAVALAMSEKGVNVLTERNIAGYAIECMVFNHLNQLRKKSLAPMCYWKARARNQEVDFAVIADDATIPIEVKYRKEIDVRSEFKGLDELHVSRGFSKGYIVTESVEDIGPAEPINHIDKPEGKIMKVPALLFCYWLGTFAHRGDLEMRL